MYSIYEYTKIQTNLDDNLPFEKNDTYHLCFQLKSNIHINQLN